MTSRRARTFGDHATVTAWAEEFPDLPDWVAANAPDLHRAGYSPRQARDLFTVMSQVTGNACPPLARLVTAARLADLDPGLLPLWVRANIRPAPARAGATRRRAGRAHDTGVNASPSRWITLIRKYVTATGGDQRLSAMAARAGLTPAEVSAARERGDLDLATLDMMGALRDQDDLGVMQPVEPSAPERR